MLPSKVCPVCRQRKSWEHYYPKAHWPDGTIRRVQSYCKQCNTKKCAEWRAENWDHWRELRASNTRRWLANPENRAIKQEQDRTRRRVRFGIPPERWRESKKGQPGVEVMAAPFGEWISYVMTRDDVPLSELAVRWGVSEGTLRRAKNRAGGTVELATVEAALCADGTCLVSDLYDDQELAA